MEEPDLIIGVSTDPEKLKRRGIAKYSPPPGSKQMLCRFCQDEVWVGPESARAVQAGRGVVSCVECLLTKIDPADPPNIVSLGGVSGVFTFAQVGPKPANN